MAHVRFKHVNVYLSPALHNLLEQYARTSPMARSVRGPGGRSYSLSSAISEILYERLIPPLPGSEP